MNNNMTSNQATIFDLFANRLVDDFQTPEADAAVSEQKIRINDAALNSLDIDESNVKDIPVRIIPEGIDDRLIQYSYLDWHITSQEAVEKTDYDSQEKVVFFRNVFTTRIPLSVDYYDAEELCWKYIKQVFMLETSFILSAYTDAIMSNKSENKRQAVLDLKLLNKGFRNKCYQFVIYTTAWIQENEKYSFSKLKALKKIEKKDEEKKLAKRKDFLLL